MFVPKVPTLLLLIGCSYWTRYGALGFSPNLSPARSHDVTCNLPSDKPYAQTEKRLTAQNAFLSAMVAATFFLTGGPAFADEYGVEVEAPTLFTGEQVMICKKRGPLGACVETEVRTSSNDNDKAQKYFKDPSALIREKQQASLAPDVGEGNPLIDKLRKQSEDNREKNDLYVQRKTFENDQSATFGPFDRQVLIMNTDGKTFTLLNGAQATRLKNAGFIGKRRDFIRQPTQEEIDSALEATGPGLADVLTGVFGGD